MDVNVGEFGILIYINLNEDVSADDLYIVLRDPSGNESTKDATLGTQTISTDIGTMTANEYITYTIADGDLDESGRWSFRAVVDTGSTIRRKSDWAQLRVKP